MGERGTPDETETHGANVASAEDLRAAFGVQQDERGRDLPVKISGRGSRPPTSQERAASVIAPAASETAATGPEATEPEAAEVAETPEEPKLGNGDDVVAHYAAKYGAEEGGVEPIRSARPNPEESPSPAPRSPGRPHASRRPEPSTPPRPLDVEELVSEQSAPPPTPEPASKTTPQPETTRPPVFSDEEVQQALERTRLANDGQQIESLTDELIDRGMLRWAQVGDTEAEELQAVSPEVTPVLNEINRTSVAAESWEQPSAQSPPQARPSSRPRSVFTSPRQQPSRASSQAAAPPPPAPEPASRPPEPETTRPPRISTELLATLKQVRSAGSQEELDSLRDELADKGALTSPEGPLILYELTQAREAMASGTEPSAETNSQTAATPEPEPSRTTITPEPMPIRPDPVSVDPGEPLPPIALEPLEQPLSLHLASLGGATKEQAILAAEERLKTELSGDSDERFHRLRTVARSVWKGNIAREYYRQKYIANARHTIEDNRNIFANQGLAREAHDEAMQSLIERFSEGDEELWREGEHADPVRAGAEHWLRDGLKAPILDYARGDMTSEALQEAQTRVLYEVQKRYPELLGEEYKMVASNLVDVAEQIKGMADTDLMRERLIDGVRIFEDTARVGVDTDVLQSKVDRVIEGMHKGPLRVVNEATLGIAVGVAYSAGIGATRSIAARAAATVAPGALTGLLAGARERRMIRGERLRVMQQREAGGQEVTGNSREARLEGTVYGLMSYAEASSQMEDALTEEHNGTRHERAHSPEWAAQALATLAEIKARQSLANREKIGLLAFSSVDKVEAERLDLLRRSAAIRAALRDWFETADPGQRAALGTGDFDAILDQKIDAATIGLEQDRDQKDRRFGQMRRRAVGTAMLKGAAFGAFFGLIGQEAAAQVDGQQGELNALLHEHVSKGEHQTFLRSLLAGGATHRSEVMPGNGVGTGAGVGAGTHVEQMVGHSHVRLPAGVELQHQPDGSMTMVYGNEHVAGLTMHDGSLDARSVADIQQHLGGRVEQHEVLVAGRAHMAERSVGAYFAEHHKGVSRIERSYWEGDQPEANPMRLSAPRLDHNGNYVFSIAGMTEGGSSHDGVAAHVPDLVREGKMRIFLSASEGSQDHAFNVAFDHHGNAIIDKTSVAGRSLFSHHDGEVSFNGRFAEVGQTIGHDHGVDQVRVFATGEGEGVSQIRELVHSQHYENVATIDLSSTSPDTGLDAFTNNNWLQTPAAARVGGGGGGHLAASTVDVPSGPPVEAVPLPSVPIYGRSSVTAERSSRAKRAKAAVTKGVKRGASQAAQRTPRRPAAPTSARSARRPARPSAAEAPTRPLTRASSPSGPEQPPEPREAPRSSERQATNFGRWSDQVGLELSRASSSAARIKILLDGLNRVAPAIRARAAQYVLQRAGIFRLVHYSREQAAGAAAPEITPQAPGSEQLAKALTAALYGGN